MSDCPTGTSGASLGEHKPSETSTCTCPGNAWTTQRCALAVRPPRKAPQMTHRGSRSRYAMQIGTKVPRRKDTGGIAHSNLGVYSCVQQVEQSDWGHVLRLWGLGLEVRTTKEIGTVWGSCGSQYYIGLVLGRLEQGLTGPPSHAYQAVFQVSMQDSIVSAKCLSARCSLSNSIFGRQTSQRLIPLTICIACSTVDRA